MFEQTRHELRKELELEDNAVNHQSTAQLTEEYLKLSTENVRLFSQLIIYIYIYNVTFSMIESMNNHKVFLQCFIAV